MLLKLRDEGLLRETLPKGAVKIQDELIYNKAIIDLLFDNKDNCDRFLYGDYDEIRFTDHVHNKKGKLVKCRAYFAKRMTIYKEI